MNKLRTRLLVFSLILITAVGISGFKLESRIPADNMNFPPDFLKHKSHILVPLYDLSKPETWGFGIDEKRYPKGLNKYYVSLFAKDYKGDYDIVQCNKDVELSKDSIGIMEKFKIINDAYSDIDKYRYVLYSYVYLGQFHSSRSDDGQEHHDHEYFTGYAFGLYDRKENKMYKVDSYRLDLYVQSLEESRAK